jgi:hypothetical protein
LKNYLKRIVAASISREELWLLPWRTVGFTSPCKTNKVMILETVYWQNQVFNTKADIQGESKKTDTFDIQMNNKGVSFF